jgi:hypothetical protein
MKNISAALFNEKNGFMTLRRNELSAIFDAEMLK